MFCIWLTGIPGSGKSTIAKELADELKKKNISVQILRLDEIRKVVTLRITAKRNGILFTEHR
ncbi:MAG: hypothetical protein BWK75_01430 [Candidatus Altiarchaeales archaeon A3]|nr:MAG: hypothetical protein BWK75_01430 [Candidatus Altiarchaeales archaeon A3]